MFAVVATWVMDAVQREGQEAVLPGLVEGVRRTPGFVHGYWSKDVDDSGVSLTFVVFETLGQARSFRDAVMANVPAQREVGVDRTSIRIVNIQADAS